MNFLNGIKTEMAPENRREKPKTVAMQPAAQASQSIVCKTSRGRELHTTLLRLSRRQVVLEIYDPHLVLQMSEVMRLEIGTGTRRAYAGRGVIRNLVNTGATMICEVTLDDPWQEEDLQRQSLVADPASAGQGFGGFLTKWQKVFKIDPEYKILIADLQSFLMELRMWLEDIELEIGATPQEQREAQEEKVVTELAGPVLQVIDRFFDKFETIAEKLEEELRGVHHAYMRRQLHSLVLCSPFAYRTFQKPLGYAGDYEMVNMMMRKTEGNTLFAKIVNHWFLKQPPAEAHRNRVIFLADKLVEETLRATREKRPMLAYNLGCGPAWEVQKFLNEKEISNRAQFTLVDFNEETLQHTRETLEEIKHKTGRRTKVEYQRKSVQQIIKEGGKGGSTSREPRYDMVYCAGLFDYLTDAVCQRLMNNFYEMIRPGGLLLVTNVDRSNPLRNGMEHLLDWHLNYRTSREARTLKPDKATADECTVKSDNTGVNIFIEVRKPNDHK